VSLHSRLATVRAACLLALGWSGLVWLGGEMLAGGFGQERSYAAASSADLAALVGAAEAKARTSAAEARLEAASAEAAARQALRRTPLDPGAFALLGLAAAARDEPDRATALMQFAAARAPADLLTQGWLLHRRLLSEDMSGAILHADAMLRAQPAVLQQLLPALAAIAASDEGMPSLAEHLASEPPWRSRFLELLATETADPLAPFALFSALMEGSRPPSHAELRPYLKRLVEAGLYEQARLLWTQALPVERLAEIGYLANGGFSEEPTGFLFDWSLEPVAGAGAEIATVPDGDGNRALRIQFLDRRVAYRHVRQLLMLMPGRYRLTGRVKAEDLRNERGLHWTLSCADQPDTRLGASERVSGTTRWQRFDVAFEVPASGCRAQWLRLELAARIASERHVAGAIWYDDLAVSRIDDPEADTCPDEGPPHGRLSASLDEPATVATAASRPDLGEADAECTCATPAGTAAELVEVTGDVIVFRGEQSLSVEGRADLVPGDRVMVRGGGRAMLAQGQCRFDLMPQSVVTLREEACVLCTAVLTAGEAEVAYGQSAGGAIAGGTAAGGTIGGGTIGGGAIGGGTVGSGVLGGASPVLVTRPASPPLPNLVVLPGGDTRPPASQ
jgi:hypothetical protein